ncbi:MAG: collagen-like triple helix repeat-containing protein [Romboutsia sp.]|uniref:collagen-like triple helix repeat-containing protein n=1 Tax=Romboutsia sp. TaxID=1965302 RepID=UPI003F38C833
MENSMCNTNSNRCNYNNSGNSCICPPGAVGPKGATGPAGPTGPTGGAIPLQFVNIIASSSQYTINTPIALTLTTNATPAISLSGNSLVLAGLGNYLIIANATFTSTPILSNYETVVFKMINALTNQVIAESTNSSISDLLSGPVSLGTVVTTLGDPIALNFIVSSTSGQIIDFSIQVIKIG